MVKDAIVNNEKLCPKCDKMLPLNSFHKSTRRENGYQLWCKNCGLMTRQNSYHTYRKDAVRQLSRATALKSNYNLTIAQYNDLLESQDSVCAICKKPETVKSNPNGRTDSLRVDHCHETGKIRGLLCSACNFGISQFKDNTNLLLQAIFYLESNKDSPIKFKVPEKKIRPQKSVATIAIEA